MTLDELLAGTDWRGPQALASREVAGLEYDSRRTGADFLFFAFPGAKTDGRLYAEEAWRKQALAVVSESPAPDSFGGAWIQVPHGRKALAIAAKRFYGEPDRRIHFTGITGTNGKTTTAYLAESILLTAGMTTGMLGTIEYRLAGEVLPAPNTTPESLDIMRFAAELIARGGTHLISEVSSHALALGRVHGFHFHTAAFTNFTRDHLDFHKTMEAYRDAKALLFRPEAGGAPEWAILNADDETSSFMRSASQTLFYGVSSKADLRAENIHSGFEGLRFDLVWQGTRQRICSALTSKVNVHNLLAAAGIGLSYGLDLNTIARGMEACRSVPGRFERVDAGQPFLVVVDYAHTDDALRNTIRMARTLTSGRVITVFGCGGDRDRSKRPLMGMAAGELSDYAVLTSDNPRSEEPLSIMNDAMVGLNRFDTPHYADPDRKAAIRHALAEARSGDVVLLAGKGHENYQVLKSGTIHFDDREVARELLTELGYRRSGG